MSALEGFEKNLKKWDGKTVNDIERIYSRYHYDVKFVSQVVDLLNKDTLQIGASWLLKRFLEDKHTLEESTVSRIFRHVPYLVSWESKLHILQCIPHLPIPLAETDIVERFLRDCLADKNKFVRAWAYGGFYELANQHPEYREEARQYIEIAMREESASVKARIRNSVKKGFMAN